MASVDVVEPSGPDVIVGGGGGGVSLIVHAKRLTPLRRPLAVRARTRKTCSPRPRPRYVLGFAQRRQRAASSRHSALVPRSKSQANVAFLEIHGRTGAVVITGR